MSTQAPVVTQHADPVRPMVFYDGGCPLCRREIAHYRRIDSAERLRWVDALNEPGDPGRAWPLLCSGQWLNCTCWTRPGAGNGESMPSWLSGKIYRHTDGWRSW